MNEQISINAEHVRILLSLNGEMTLRQIGEHTHLRDSIIFMAIGWLMKDEKIHITDKNGILYFCLRPNNITEIYY